MSNKLSITELCRRVGDENITIQSLNQNLAEVKVGKENSRITFYTDRAKGADWASSVAVGTDPMMSCLILWIPRDKAVAAMEEPQPEEKTPT